MKIQKKNTYFKETKNVYVCVQMIFVKGHNDK